MTRLALAVALIGPASATRAETQPTTADETVGEGGGQREPSAPEMASDSAAAPASEDPSVPEGKPPAAPDVPSLIPPPPPPAPGAERAAMKGALLLSVGVVGSDTGPGLAADFGMRVQSVSLRLAYRYTTSDSPNGDVTFTSGRFAWNKELAPWAQGFVGIGFGQLRRRLPDEWVSSATSPGKEEAMVLEAGLGFEQGPFSVAGLGVELLLPLGSGVGEVPTVLVTMSINPILLLAMK